MELGAFRTFRMALGMNAAAAEEVSATGDEQLRSAPPAAAPPPVPLPVDTANDPAKQRTDSASSAGSRRSSRSDSHRRRRHQPPPSRPVSQSEELHLPLDQEFVPVEGDDDVREEVICAIFDLPRSTTFYKDFSCAIAAAFPMHGRMYPTSTHVCFYSNVFGRERKILIPYESITELSKTTTLVFQGAIRIKTSSKEDFTFSSFWGTNRDRCFDLIQTIRDDVLGVSDEAIENNANEEGSAVHRQEASGDDNTQQTRLQRTVSDGGIVAVPRDTTMELLLEEKFPVSVDDFLAMFIVDNAPFGLVRYNECIGTTEIQCNPWSARSEDESLGQTRSLQFRVPIESPIGPSSSMVDVLQCHKTSDRGVHTIETSTRLVDIPYGDYFSVEDRWTVVPLPRSPNECSLTIELKVVFSKSTFWKGKIESRAIADNKAKWIKWVEMAQEFLRAPISSEEGGRVASPSTSSSSSTATPPTASAATTHSVPPPAASVATTNSVPPASAATTNNVPPASAATRNSTSPIASAATSNGTPLHAAPFQEKDPLVRRLTGVVVEQRSGESLRDRSRNSSRAQKSRRRLSAQAFPWIVIVILVWIIFRLNKTLTRMEQAMISTELSISEIQHHISRLQTGQDVCR